MYTKSIIKEKLLNTGILSDCEWLDKYVDLIYHNIDSEYIPGKSHKHHIIPRCYFTHIICDENSARDNESFTVNVLMKEHIIAHCYLCLSTTNEWFKYFMYMSVKQIIGCKYPIKLSEIEKLTYRNLDIVQQCYEQCAHIRISNNPMRVTKFKSIHDNKMKSPEVRKKISDTLHARYVKGELFTAQHREKLRDAVSQRTARGDTFISKNGYVGGVSGLVMLYSPDGHRVYKKPDEVDDFLSQGYNKPVKKRNLSSTPLHLIPVGQPHTRTLHISRQQLHETLSRAHLGKSPSNKGIPCPQSTRSKISHSLCGRRVMTDGIHRVCVKPENFELYAQKGFIFVRNNRNKYNI